MAEPVKAPLQWLDEFARDAESALDELLRGIADVASYERAEPADVLVMLFGGLAEESSERRTLDESIGRWLADRRKDGPEVRRRYGMHRYLDELIQALSSVYRLHLPETAAMLRRELPSYEHWLRGLFSGPSWDPAGELWRALALSQKDRGLLGAWYHLCGEAGRGLPEHYVDIGLLGLRHLPGPDEGSEPDGRLNGEALAGLFRWAAHLPEGPASRKNFQRRLGALRVLYPRGPNRWRELVEPLLDAYPAAPFRDWFEGVGLKLRSRRRGKSKGFPSLPPRSRLRDILKRVEKESVSQLLSDVRELVNEYESYAKATGDAGFLVKTACNFSSRLRHKAPREALRLARRALRWQPFEPETWNHLAEAWKTLGQDKRAEVIYWETTRRFPENVVARTALADLLAKNQRLDEAEELLRETIRRFPENVVARNTLAELFAKSDRAEEAEGLFRETMKLFSYDRIAPHALAFWLLRWDRVEEAEKLYQTIRSTFSVNEHTRMLAQELARRIEGWHDEIELLEKETETPPDETLSEYEPIPDTADMVAEPIAGYDEDETGEETSDLEIDPYLEKNATIGRADFQLRSGQNGTTRKDALARIEELLEEDPEHVYPRLILGLHDETWRRQVAEEAEVFHNAYPLRFLAARETSREADWNRLLGDFSDEHRPLTLLGRLAAANGGADPADAARLATWVEHENGDRKGFSAFTAERLKSWLGDEPAETKPETLLNRLSEHRQEIEMLIGDGLRRTADESALA